MQYDTYHTLIIPPPTRVLTLADLAGEWTNGADELLLDLDQQHSDRRDQAGHDRALRRWRALDLYMVRGWFVGADHNAADQRPLVRLDPDAARPAGKNNYMNNAMVRAK